MSFCLLPKKVEEFKQALKEKDLNIADLLKMTTEERTAEFSKYAGDNAKAVNTLFEEKLVLKNRMLGVQNLFSKLGEFGKNSAEHKAQLAQALSDFRAKQQERIFSPTEHETFLNDLADKRLGIHISQEQAGKVFELSGQIKDLKIAAKDSILGTTPELLDKQAELNQYMNSVNAKPAWTSIRDSLSSLYKNLFIGVKTGVKTTALGTLNSAIELVTRRVGAAKVIGDVSLANKTQAIAENIKMYAKTGHNTFLMTSLEDNSGAFGASKKGFSESFGGKDAIQGTGVMPTVAKGVNLASRAARYFAIDILHKAPMSITSSVNFADALDITSSQLAKMDIAKGMDANTIFKDALKVEPQTDLGKIARLRSQEDMFRVLNINNTPLSEAAIGLQKTLNKAVPTLGNYVLPMAKVPSSVIYNQLENFGGGFATGTYNIIKGVGELSDLKKLGQESSVDGVNATLKIRNGVNTLVRTIGVVGTAVLITQNLNKKDFYSDNYGNSYVKMGNYWLSTNAFGGASTAVSGMMMAKTGNTGFIYDYGKAGFNSLSQAPVVDSLTSMVQKGQQGKLGSGIVNSYINPILAQDIEKSIKEQSINPALVGTLIRTEQQKIQEDKANKLKASQARKAKKK